MALFKNPTTRRISTSIDGHPVKAAPGGTCEIPDHKAFAVALLGLPLVPVVEQPKAADPPEPDKVPPVPVAAPVVVAPAPAPAPAPAVVAPVPVVVSSIVARPPVATAPVLAVQEPKPRGGRGPATKDAAPASPVVAPEKSAEKP